jgi:2,3-bisphosphoglycerate-independent phosphoglycerate mutase
MTREEETASRGGNALAEAVRGLYRAGQTDYFLEPLVLISGNGEPVGRIREGDAVIFCCRRGEREIQLTRAFADPSFDAFPRLTFQELTFVTMTLYHEMFWQMDVAVAYPPLGELKDTLGEVLTRHRLRQLRVAESEKFAHVTVFLNGGTSRAFPGEDDVRVPSPKGVPFDQVPEMSSAQVAEQVVKGIEAGEYALIVVNFANGDVIGHLADRGVKISCAEAVDRQLGRVMEAAASAGYVTLVTADHGVLEMAIRPDGTPNVGHTDSSVPFAIVDPNSRTRGDTALREGGVLADVAPTVLQVIGLPKPELMTGQGLLRNYLGTRKGRKVLLVVMDGWGLGKQDETNPIYLADTPVWDRLIRQHPFTALKASGKAVGLLERKAGNSEAGHMNIGAGRVVIQDDARIDLAIEDGSYYKNPVFLETMELAQRRNSALHLIALLSERSSHGSISYPLALLRLAKERDVEEVYVHAIFDGRSTQPGSAPLRLERLDRKMQAIGVGQIVSGMGRGLALDRDGNYYRTRQTYDALVFGSGRAAGK